MVTRCVPGRLILAVTVGGLGLFGCSGSSRVHAAGSSTTASTDTTLVLGPLPSLPPPATDATGAPADRSSTTSGGQTATTTTPSTVARSSVPPTSSAAAPSGVKGTVTAGPTCPVQTVGQTCTQPVKASLKLTAADGTVVASGSSAANGTYTVAAPAGTYTLTATPSTPGPRCPPVQVTIHANQYTTADIFCDTGIR